MAYVVTDACIDVQDRSCIEECPVDCIYPGPRMMYINPEECVDCGRCEPACPVTSIYHEEDLPGEKEQFASVNETVFLTLGLGSPGGARKTLPLSADHEEVAAWTK